MNKYHEKNCKSIEEATDRAHWMASYADENYYLAQEHRRWMIISAAVGGISLSVDAALELVEHTGTQLLELSEVGLFALGASALTNAARMGVEWVIDVRTERSLLNAAADYASQAERLKEQMTSLEP